MKKLFLIIISISLFLGCTSEESTPKVETTVKEQKEKIKIPSFNQDSAYLYVKNQVDFGPRVNNSEAHKKCETYLVNAFENYGLKVHTQKGVAKAYDGLDLSFTNIIAQLNPEKANRIFISAHWDSRHIAENDKEDKSSPILGANDGASGVGIILEIARIVTKNHPNIGVDFILWDAEDHGNPGTQDSYCLGSQYWTKNIIPAGYSAKYGINLDMVGAEGATFPYEGYSYYYAPELCNKLWSIAHKLGYENYFHKQKTGPITDDHYYVSTNTNIPCIDVIHKDLETEQFHSSWHTQQDDMSVISKATLKAVGQTLIALIYTEK